MESPVVILKLPAETLELLKGLCAGEGGFSDVGEPLPADSLEPRALGAEEPKPGGSLESWALGAEDPEPPGSFPVSDDQELAPSNSNWGRILVTVTLALIFHSIIRDGFG